MTQTDRFDKISPTALLVAYARQFSDIPYTAELARLVNAQATVDQFAKGDRIAALRCLTIDPLLFYVKVYSDI